MKKLYAKPGEDRLSNEYLSKRIRYNSVVSETTGCWVWQRHINNLGYGQVTVNARLVYAHRLAYAVFKGAIGDLYVLHRCDNPACVNPEHLFLGTQSDNMRDCVAKGRSKLKPNSLPGERNPQSKLTRLQVALIRKRLANGDRQQTLAEEFNVSQSAISSIKVRTRWRFSQ